MNKTIKGGDMMVFLGGKSIAVATSHTIDINMEVKQTSSKDSGGKWETNEAGVLSWSAKSENITSAGKAGLTYDDLVDLMIERKPVHLVLAPKQGDGDEVPEEGWSAEPGKGREGDAYITAVSKSDPNGDNSTFSVDFTGTGKLSKVAEVAAG